MNYEDIRWVLTRPIVKTHPLCRRGFIARESAGVWSCALDGYFNKYLVVCTLSVLVACVSFGRLHVAFKNYRI